MRMTSMSAKNDVIKEGIGDDWESARRCSENHINYAPIPHKGDLLFDNFNPDELLTAEQLAKRLNIAVKTIRKWRYIGYFPPNCVVKLRHNVRYHWGQVLRWLQTKGV
jgi:hypothetical protein